MAWKNLRPGSGPVGKIPGKGGQMRTVPCSETVTLAASDVRQVMAWIAQEIETLCAAYRPRLGDLDLESALVDCSVLALNDVISQIRLQLGVGEELICEYVYDISYKPLTAFG